MDIFNTCPCCGYKTLEGETYGITEICPLCFWENNTTQYHDPDFKGEANRLSLREAQENFKEYGVSDRRYKDFTRGTINDYEYVGPLDISRKKRIAIEEMMGVFHFLELPLEKLLTLYISDGTKVAKDLIFPIDELRKVVDGNDLNAYLMLNSETHLANLGEIELNDAELETLKAEYYSKFLQQLKEFSDKKG